MQLAAKRAKCERLKQRSKKHTTDIPKSQPSHQQSVPSQPQACNADSQFHHRIQGVHHDGQPQTWQPISAPAMMPTPATGQFFSATRMQHIGQLGSGQLAACLETLPRSVGQLPCTYAWPVGADGGMYATAPPAAGFGSNSNTAQGLMHRFDDSEQFINTSLTFPGQNTQQDVPLAYPHAGSSQYQPSRYIGIGNDRQPGLFRNEVSFHRGCDSDHSTQVLTWHSCRTKCYTKINPKRRTKCHLPSTTAVTVQLGPPIPQPWQTPPSQAGKL